MEQLTPTTQPTYTTAEVNAIFERAKRLISHVDIINTKLGSYRTAKDLESRNNGRLLLRAIGSTVPGRGTGRTFWYFESVDEECRAPFTDAKLFGSLPLSLVIGVRK